MVVFSEKLFIQMADRVAEDGYKEAGYQYVCIDVSKVFVTGNSPWLIIRQDKKKDVIEQSFSSSLKAFLDIKILIAKVLTIMKVYGLLISFWCLK